MASGENDVLQEVLQQFQDHLHSQVPLDSARWNFHEDAKINEVGGAGKSEILKVLIQNIVEHNSGNVNEVTVCEVLKQFGVETQKMIDECLEKNNEKKREHESIMKMRMDRLLEDYKTSMEEKLKNQNQDLNLKKFLEDGKLLAVKYFEHHWSHGNAELFEEEQGKLIEKLEKLQKEWMQNWNEEGGEGAEAEMITAPVTVPLGREDVESSQRSGSQASFCVITSCQSLRSNESILPATKIITVTAAENEFSDSAPNEIEVTDKNVEGHGSITSVDIGVGMATATNPITKNSHQPLNKSCDLEMPMIEFERIEEDEEVDAKNDDDDDDCVIIEMATGIFGDYDDGNASNSQIQVKHEDLDFGGNASSSPEFSIGIATASADHTAVHKDQRHQRHESPLNFDEEEKEITDVSLASSSSTGSSHQQQGSPLNLDEEDDDIADVSITSSSFSSSKRAKLNEHETPRPRHSTSSFGASASASPVASSASSSYSIENNHDRGLIEEEMTGVAVTTSNSMDTSGDEYPLLFRFTDDCISIGTWSHIHGNTGTFQTGNLSLAPLVGINAQGHLICGGDLGPDAMNCTEQWSVLNFHEYFMSPEKLTMKVGARQRISIEVKLEFLLGFLLRTLKNSAELQFAKTFQAGVIIVPWWLSSMHRILVRDAAMVAGFGEVHLLNQESLHAYNFASSRLGSNDDIVVLSENFGIITGIRYHWDNCLKKLEMIKDDSFPIWGNGHEHGNQEESIQNSVELCKSLFGEIGATGSGTTILLLAKSTEWNELFQKIGKELKNEFKCSVVIPSLTVDFILSGEKLEEITSSVVEYLPTTVFRDNGLRVVVPAKTRYPSEIRMEIPANVFHHSNFIDVFQGNYPRKGEYFLPVGAIEFMAVSHQISFCRFRTSGRLRDYTLVVTLRVTKQGILQVEGTHLENTGEGQEEQDGDEDMELVRNFVWMTPGIDDFKREGMKQLIDAIFIAEKTGRPVNLSRNCFVAKILKN